MQQLFKIMPYIYFQYSEFFADDELLRVNQCQHKSLNDKAKNHGTQKGEFWCL